ncbi:ABC transporter ATP-binding protein [Rhizomonospora bruguierae]|uniref:ABC transporter ATP-binding protein n=1 Tax=Rhizomonospora bruguierae TaxID=1581705 RepID=UPI001BCBF51F|nr:ABC transporter ATP-binding protein [Micromonospora sp. NBRC 107566]
MILLLLCAGGATAAGIAVPMVVRRVIDGPVQDGDTEGVALLGALALVLGVVEAALIFVRRWVQSSTSLAMETQIRDDLYAHMQRLPVAFHHRWQSGQLLSRVTTDLGVLRRFLSFGLVFLIVNSATYVVVVALLVHLHWPLGLIVAASAVPLFLLSKRFTRDYLVASRRMQDQLGDLATLIEESAQGLRTIKAFGRRSFMAEQFAAAAGTLRDTAVGKSVLVARTSARFELVPNLALAVVLVAGAVVVADGGMTIGGLVAFVSLQLMLVWPVESLGWIIANGQEAMTASDRIFEVLDIPPSIVDRPGAVAVGRVEGRLRFENVGFTYPGTGQPVLCDVNLEIEPGETLALVGVTGSGKTTLASLVPRLYDVTSGRVTLDGTDVRDLRLDSLRAAVAVAFEDPVLFSMSVRENIALGRPDATDADIGEALAVAQAEFVYDLPWGLNTRIGEQGLSLSGGQRQRLALARAVLGRPRVLVLDDPLSALDVHTEALVEQALARVLTGSTALLVVHRPSTVALADRVALLEDGRISAVGTHSELLATVPAYRAVLSAAAEQDPDDLGLVVG